MGNLGNDWWEVRFAFENGVVISINKPGTEEKSAIEKAKRWARSTNRHRARNFDRAIATATRIYAVPDC